MGRNGERKEEWKGRIGGREERREEKGRGGGGGDEKDCKRNMILTGVVVWEVNSHRSSVSTLTLTPCG